MATDWPVIANLPAARRALLGAFVGALCFLAGPARAESINWFSDPGGVNLTSAGLPMDGGFRFELGVFTGGFVPTSANTSEWAANWVPAQRAVYDAVDKLFSGQVTVTGNAAPFTVNAKAYIWGFSGDGLSSQWILFSKNTWSWPAPNPLDPFGLTWYTPESNEVIVGSINSTGRPYLMKSAAVADSPLPVTSWTQWLDEELGGQTQTGMNEDPDHDGVSNLFEFIYGTSPQIAQAPGQSAVSMTERDGAAYLQMVFSRRADHPTNLTVEVSDDLLKWESGPAQAEVVAIDPTNFTARDLTALGPDHPRRFMRLRATLP